MCIRDSACVAWGSTKQKRVALSTAEAEIIAPPQHVARRHFFVRDQVEGGEISVRLVKTDDNAADFFSKPLKPSSFFSLRDSIMNIQRE